MTTMGVALLLGALSVGPARAAEPQQTIAPEPGRFIDDAFALRSDGKAIAYATTDGATATTLHLAQIGGGGDKSVPGLPSELAAIHWLDDTRVLVVARAGESAVTAQAWTTAGASGPKLGPAQHIALATIGGKRVVITYSKKEGRGGAEHLLVAYARDTLKPVARRSLKEDGDGRVPHPTGALKILWWRDGFAQAAVLQAGGFDKAKDMRRPDRFARFDPWAPKPEVADPSDITDVLAFAEVSLLHGKHGPDGTFVTISEDRKSLLLVDGLTMAPITLPRPIAIYDAEQFHWQPIEGDVDHLWLSATVDPTNPEALARKKADRDDFTLFVLERGTRAVKKVLDLPGQNRPTAWHIGGDKLALLRKSKGFGRGGVAIEIWPISK
jgi:hypothetical protein